MNITLKTVDPSAMRYATTGDWRMLAGDMLQVTVAGYGGRKDDEFLVALHELVEVYLCRKRGISDEMVMKWDLENPELQEPGNHSNSPYNREHRIATYIEYLMAQEIGLNWEEHERWVQNACFEVEQASLRQKSSISINGPRAWAELHLFTLRHDGSDDSEWLARWVKSLNFEGCPCEQHLKRHLQETPPDWNALFEWGITLHNAVNERLGKPVIPLEDAKALWEYRSF